MEIQKSQKTLEKNQKNQKIIKKNQILGCFLKIPKIAKNPGFDSFLMFFFAYFLIIFGGNHGNPKIAKNPRKKSKKIKKESKKNQKNQKRIKSLIFSDF